MEKVDPKEVLRRVEAGEVRLYPDREFVRVKDPYIEEAEEKLYSRVRKQ